ncbi:hypothetical protein V6N13_010357 [Hibiscus sabdariffa]
MEDWGIDFGLENNEEDDVTKEIYHVTALVGQYTSKQLCKVPRRTSEQTGHAWVQEILQGHPIRCYEMFRMEKHIFHMLCTELVESGLKVTTRMGIEEMVAMFLNMVGHAQGNRMIQERFQHSGETVSRHLHKVTTRMGIEEMVAMFLNMVGHAQGNRMIQERFQHSGETVSRHLHKVLIACLRKSETDSEFNRYEGEDMVEHDDDDHGSVDPSIRLTVASSTEMDLVRDSIRDQIVEHMKLN